MKVRIIKKPEFTFLHHVQVKRLWFPFWMTVGYDGLEECKKIANNLLTHGKDYSIVFYGETNENSN